MTKLNDIFQEVDHHYTTWTDDMERRKTGEDGWDDIIDAYWGKLPDNWPYDSRVTDPRIRTTLLEKKARLTNSKLRGRLIPREGGDVLRARLQNNLIDFQWDSANYGGSMSEKWGMMDINARVFGSSFAHVYWRREEDEEGNAHIYHNEFMPILPLNVGLDPAATHVRDAKWVQIRSWMTIEEIEKEIESSVNSRTSKSRLAEFRKRVAEGTQNRRDNEYTSRTLQNQGLEDRVGEDMVFPVHEVVIEYRPDKKIMFAPKHKYVFYDVENPFKHRSIPIVQLRYYPLIDDPMGESEVRSVLPLWRAIQYVMCGYLDNMNLHIRPPLKIVADQVRMETIEYGPEAMWIMDSLDAVQEHTGSPDSLRYFETTYSVLVSAFNQAMGDLSQGVSSVDPFENDKTATEIRAIAKQQNVRDQNNQLYLSDAIKDMMRMWMSNNRQFLFEDAQHEYIIRVIGKKAFNYYVQAGLDELVPDAEAMRMVKEAIEQNPQISDQEIEVMYEAALTPKYPVVENPNQRDPDKLRIKPKMRLNETNDQAELSIVPDDLEGTYDYVPDVKSMAAGANQEMIQSRQQAINALTTNPIVMQMLQSQGYTPNIRDMFIDQLEETGLRDAERYFEEIKSDQTIGSAAASVGGVQQTQPVSGGTTQPVTPVAPNANQQMAGSTNGAQPGAVFS